MMTIMGTPTSNVTFPVAPAPIYTDPNDYHNFLSFTLVTLNINEQKQLLFGKVYLILRLNKKLFLSRIS